MPAEVHSLMIGLKNSARHLDQIACRLRLVDESDYIVDSDFIAATWSPNLWCVRVSPRVSGCLPDLHCHKFLGQERFQPCFRWHSCRRYGPWRETPFHITQAWQTPRRMVSPYLRSKEIDAADNPRLVMIVSVDHDIARNMWTS